MRTSNAEKSVMAPPNFQWIDLAPKTDNFRLDVVLGLSQPQKTLEPKYFYDATGAALFDQICELDEYYVTRTELNIMKTLRPPSADRRPLAVIELGGANSFKFRKLLGVMPDIEMYIAIDIAAAPLKQTTQQLASDYPQLEVVALCADYQQLASFDFSLCPEELTPVVFFPGSTIGNLSREEATGLFTVCRRLIGDDGYMLLGCDLIKPRDVLLAAYNDAKGVTARFNLNLLERINRELGANFDLGGFCHSAVLNEEKSRIEMHLVSLCQQKVTVAGHTFRFAPGETIHTENSRKYNRSKIAELARKTGLTLQKWTTDPLEYFAICQLGADHISLQEQARQPDLMAPLSVSMLAEPSENSLP